MIHIIIEIALLIYILMGLVILWAIIRCDDDFRLDFEDEPFWVFLSGCFTIIFIWPLGLIYLLNIPNLTNLLLKDVTFRRKK